MEQLYASSILLFKSQFAFEHVDNFSLQNGRLGDKAVIKKKTLSNGCTAFLGDFFSVLKMTSSPW